MIWGGKAGVRTWGEHWSWGVWMRGFLYLFSVLHLCTMISGLLEIVYWSADLFRSKATYKKLYTWSKTKITNIKICAWFSGISNSYSLIHSIFSKLQLTVLFSDRYFVEWQACSYRPSSGWTRKRWRHWSFIQWPTYWCRMLSYLSEIGLQCDHFVCLAVGMNLQELSDLSCLKIPLFLVITNTG